MQDMIMRTGCGWIKGHGMSLALNKAEIVVLTNKRIQTIVPMRAEDLQIETKPKAKTSVPAACEMLNGGHYSLRF